LDPVRVEQASMSPGPSCVFVVFVPSCFKRSGPIARRDSFRTEHLETHAAMLTRDLPLHVLALLVYPGLVLVLAVGAVAEVGTAFALAGGGLRAALLAPTAWPRRAVRRPTDLMVPLLATLAATQLAAPFSPVPPVERNLLVAAVATAAAVWLAGGGAWTAGTARRTLLVQVCWLLALLAPALVSESLRPQALGAVVVPSALPVKVAAGLLALLCLPALLRLAPGGGEADPDAAARLPLWLPVCGLLVSLFIPPSADDAGGLLRFLAATLATAAVAVGLAVAIRRTSLYPRLLAPLALVVVAIAAVTSALT
jgi:hypothetical protein